MKVNIDMNTTANKLLIQTIAAIDGAYASSTIRAYRANFERFIQFYEDYDTCPLPADPQDVACYISSLTKSGLKS